MKDEKQKEWLENSNTWETMFRLCVLTVFIVGALTVLCFVPSFLTVSILAGKMSIDVIYKGMVCGFIFMCLALIYAIIFIIIAIVTKIKTANSRKQKSEENNK